MVESVYKAVELVGAGTESGEKAAAVAFGDGVQVAARFAHR
jgi:flavin-binding protein dodecin